MKKLLMAVLMCLFMFQAGNVLAADVPVYLNDVRIASAQENNGYTYLPLRTMFEAVGATVEWNAAEQKIIANLADGRVLQMQTGSKKAYCDNNEYTMQVTPYISNGTTYVPIRFITDDILKYGVDYRNGAVYLQAPGQTVIVPATNPTATSSGIRPEIKNLMDEIEKFVNEYCDFLIEFSSIDDADELINKMPAFTDYMARLDEYSNKIESMDFDSLSKEEQEYCTEAEARWMKKLEEIERLTNN